MKTYCVFKNDGEVDVNAFKLLGASSKETDDTKIGFWGSGLKYAMAVLLRHDIEILVSSGEKEIKVAKRKTKMRGETFDVITINGAPTSITTRAGKDWELWFAIREIYANGLDEDGFEMTVADRIEPVKGQTKMYIEMTDEVKDIFKNLDLYFSTKRHPLDRFGKTKIFERAREDQAIIYRRGIRVWSEKQDMLFDYDFWDIKINESRVVTSGFELNWIMAGFWKGYATLQMIQQLIVTKCWEKSMIDWSYASGTYFNDNWFTALDGKQIIPEDTAGYYKDELMKAHVILPTKLCHELHKQFGDRLKICGITASGKTYSPSKTKMTIEQAVMLKNASELLKKLEVDVTKYPVDIVVMHDDSCIGLAENGRILLSEDAFSGNKLLASTLFEEFVHLEHGLEDNTRRMQTFLFKTIIDLTSKL